MINVVAAVIQNTYGEVLIAKRKQSKILGGYWEFPGGKIENNEVPEDSLKRELKEEMNIDIQVCEMIGESVYKYARGPIRLIAYKAKIVEGDIELVDHDEFKWVKVNALISYNLAPADIPFIDLIQ